MSAQAFIKIVWLDHDGHERTSYAVKAEVLGNMLHFWAGGNGYLIEDCNIVSIEPVIG